MMKAAPNVRERCLGVVAPVAAASHVAEAERILRGAPEGTAVQHLDEAPARAAPEAHGADHEHCESVERDSKRWQNHRQERHDPIEGAFASLRGEHRRRTLEAEDEEERDDDTHEADEPSGQPPVTVQGREDPGPRVVTIRLRAQLGEDLRDVHGELVRRRVLTRVEAGPAVEAEVREIRQVAVRERAPALHRREDGAEPLAVTAGIANDQLSVGLFQQLRRRHAARPPVPRSGRTPSQS
jgi:hypothetical protein